MLVAVASLVFFKFDVITLFVLYGEAYHKEWKGNELGTKRYAYANENKLSLEGSAKIITSTSLGEYLEND